MNPNPTTPSRQEPAITRRHALGTLAAGLGAGLAAGRIPAAEGPGEAQRTAMLLGIEAPQEYIPLALFTADFWRHHGEVAGRELENILRLAEKQNARARPEDRTAAMRGAGEATVLAEEEQAIARSVAYCREVLRLP
jgi:hypothetical protein